MRTLGFALALGLVLPNAAFAYTLEIDKKDRGSFFDFGPNSRFYGDYHWDRFSWTSSPLQGERLGFLDGNQQLGFGTRILIRPAVGDDPTGTVTLSLSYELRQSIIATYDNYQPIAHNVQGVFALAIYRGHGGIRSQANRIESYPLSVDSSNFLFDLRAGDQFSLYYAAGTAMHTVYDNQTWHPVVSDPSMPGTATLGGSVNFVPISIQIVPEPGVLSFCAVGLLLFRPLLKRGRVSVG